MYRNALTFRRYAWSYRSLPAILASLLFASLLTAAEPKTGAADENAIRAAADAFVQAFDRGNAKAVASLWTEGGTFTDSRGQLFKGRKAIEATYAAFFKEHPGAKMTVAVTSIDFPAATMAVEDGMAQVTTKDSPLTASRYTAVHVLEEGKWLMASVRDSDVPLASNPARLQELAWLIGDWETAAEGAKVHNSFRWIANGSFIRRDYTVRHQGVAVSCGMQILGFDPQAGRIRSWSFDSSGGYGTAVWSTAPNGWLGESSGMLPDGTATSSKASVRKSPRCDPPETGYSVFGCSARPFR